MHQVTRRNFLGGLAVVTAGAAAGCSARAPWATPSSPPALPAALVFSPDRFTTKTTTVATADGTKQVTYRFYGPITYVARPVDAEYQSLTISVPTDIDGEPVDASNAPIIFANAVGGYQAASVSSSTGVGEASMQPGPGGEPPGVSGPPDGEVRSGGNAMLDRRGARVSLAELAVAAGYVAVEPGCRGRSLVDADGDYYGVAPAAIVDLKAAVRYLHANADRVPGNTDRIVSTGTSAGGALSALLGASGNSDRYRPHLDDLGAADAADAIFATGASCPIADLAHADGAYEWNWGAMPAQATADTSTRRCPVSSAISSPAPSSR